MKVRIINLLLLFIFLLNCKAQEKVINPEWIKNSEILNIDCQNLMKAECVNEKYGLKKKYDTESNFEIEHLGKIIFKASSKGKDFIYEVYESKYLLIYSIPIPNQFASPFGNSKSFFLCDLNNNLTYSFNIGSYSLLPMKPNRATHTFGTKSIAFINKIDTGKKEISLMFTDLKTEEKIELKLIEI